MTTTSYGTWCNRVNTFSTSPESDIADYLGGGDREWCERMETSGAVDAIATDYRAAINAALPDDVSLCGEEFIGPAHPEDDEFKGYPVDEHGSLDFKSAIEEIDLAAIVEKHDVDNITVGPIFYEIEMTSDGEIWQPVEIGEGALERGVTCADAAKTILDNWVDDQEDPEPSEWRVRVFRGSASDHSSDPDAVVSGSDD